MTCSLSVRGAVSGRHGDSLSSSSSSVGGSRNLLEVSMNVGQPEFAEEAEERVISGGTGCNSICSAFGDACYVLPVSDDGGSSSEIIRVLGGPSIGTSMILL